MQLLLFRSCVAQWPIPAFFNASLRAAFELKTPGVRLNFPRMVFPTPPKRVRCIPTFAQARRRTPNNPLGARASEGFKILAAWTCFPNFRTARARASREGEKAAAVYACQKHAKIPNPDWASRILTIMRRRVLTRDLGGIQARPGKRSSHVSSQASQRSSAGVLVMNGKVAQGKFWGKRFFRHSIRVAASSGLEWSGMHWRKCRLASGGWNVVNTPRLSNLVGGR